MKNNKKYMSQEQLHKVLNDLPDLLQPPTGDHLDEELRIGYVMETLTRAETNLADNHLSRCEKCTIEIEHLLEVTTAWEGEMGEQKLEILRQQILQRVKQPAVNQNLVGRTKTTIMYQLTQLLGRAEISWQQALSHRPTQPSMASTELRDSEQFWNDAFTLDDLELRCRANIDSRGNLTLHFSSNKLDLEGKRINLHLELFEGKLQFEATSSTGVGAMLVIPKRLVPEDLSQLKIKLEADE